MINKIIDMKKCATLLFLFLFTCLNVLWAGPVTEDNARRTAEDFFRTLSPSMMRSAKTLKLVYQPTRTKAAGSEAEYYVFAPDTLGGFVIISGDDTLTPVVGYSANAPFSGQRIPDALKAWLDDYARYVVDVQAGKAPSYLRDISRTDNVAIEPMVTTQWDQLTPYNDLCPVIGEHRAPSGCVATALAQIMKFHNWPDVGEGSYTYKDDKEETIDFSKSEYDWKNMRDQYTDYWEGDLLVPNYTEKEANAVAKLMYECGRAVDMEYGEWVSGAYTPVACGALVNYFKYSPQLKYYFREVMTTDEWVQLIRENLRLRQPLIYSGQGEAGHAFVCDGIDADDYVHINWGWSGFYNGYFDMAYLVPESTGTGGGQGYYFINQAVIAGIRPRIAGETAPEGLNLVGQELALIGKTSFPIQEHVQSYKFNVSLNKLINSDSRPIKTEVSFCMRQNGVWQSFCDTFSINMQPNSYYTKDSFEVNVITDPKSPQYMKPGVHEVMFCYKHPTKEEWYPITCGPGPDGLIIEISASDVKIRLNKEIEPAQVSFVSLTPPFGTLYTDTENTLTLSLRNTGASLFNSHVRIAFFPEGVNDNPTDFKEIIGSCKAEATPYVYGNTQMVFYVNGQLDKAGKYRVRLYTQMDSVTLVPIPEESPQYITLVPLPKEPLPVQTSQLQVIDVIQQSFSEWMAYLTQMKCLQSTGVYTGKLALYATKKGDLSGKEYKLLEQNVTISGKSSEYVEAYEYTNATILMEPGEYVAYLKYDAGDGKMLKVTPEEYNSASFELKASATPLLYVSAPIVVNGGNDVVRGSRGQLKFSLISRGDFTAEFYPTSLNNEKTVISGTPKKITLRPNIAQEVTLDYECPPDAQSGQQKVTINYSVDGVPSSNALDYGDYEASAYFNVTTSTGIEETPLSGCVLITYPDAFLLKGVTPGSHIQVVTLDGRILFKGIAADVEMSIPMSGVSSGLYIVTVKTPDGEMKALKGRRR